MEWINIKERLPDAEKTVIAFCVGGIYTAYLSAPEDWICTCQCRDGSYLYNVTHWMPLPKPPEE